jgi:hypothetical protein
MKKRLCLHHPQVPKKRLQLRKRHRWRRPLQKRPHLRRKPQLRRLLLRKKSHLKRLHKKRRHRHPPRKMFRNLKEIYRHLHLQEVSFNLHYLRIT